MSKSTRIERDSLGEMAVPATADYGVHTARAAANFPITGTLLRHYPELVVSLAMTKKAAAIANAELGSLDQKTSNAIASACDQIIGGEGHRERSGHCISLPQFGRGRAKFRSRSSMAAC